MYCGRPMAMAFGIRGEERPGFVQSPTSKKGEKNVTVSFALLMATVRMNPSTSLFAPIASFYLFIASSLSLSFFSSPVALFLYSSPAFFYSSSISSVMFLYLAVMFALELDHFLHQPRSFPHYSLFAFAFSERNKKRSE